MAYSTLIRSIASSLPILWYMSGAHGMEEKKENSLKNLLVSRSNENLLYQSNSSLILEENNPLFSPIFLRKSNQSVLEGKNIEKKYLSKKLRSDYKNSKNYSGSNKNLKNLQQRYTSEEKDTSERILNYKNLRRPSKSYDDLENILEKENSQKEPFFSDSSEDSWDESNNSRVMNETVNSGHITSGPLLYPSIIQKQKSTVNNRNLKKRFKNHNSLEPIRDSNVAQRILNYRNSRRASKSNDNLESLQNKESIFFKKAFSGYSAPNRIYDSHNDLKISEVFHKKAELLHALSFNNPEEYERLNKDFKRLSERPYLPWLSFSGGGVRGIIAAKMLMILEEKTGKQTKDLFPLMGGTSTGGLLATLMTIGVPAEDVVEMYKEYASEIFSKQFWVNPGSVRGPKYSTVKLQDVIEQYVGNKRLSDVDGDLMITTFNASRNRPEVFKSWKAKKYPHNEKKNPLLVDLLAATAAAPTYFNPVNIDGEAYVDGGLFANDPGMCMLAEIKRRYGKVNHIAVLLGTGKVDDGFIDPEKLMNRGSLAQVEDIIRYTITGNEAAARYFLTHMLPSIGNFRQLYIINPNISKEFAQMDCTNPSTLKRLELYADEFVERSKQEDWLEKLIKTVNTNTLMQKIAQPQKEKTKRKHSLLNFI